MQLAWKNQSVNLWLPFSFEATLCSFASISCKAGLVSWGWVGRHTTTTRSLLKGREHKFVQRLPQTPVFLRLYVYRGWLGTIEVIASKGTKGLSYSLSGWHCYEPGPETAGSRSPWPFNTAVWHSEMFFFIGFLPPPPP